VTASLIARAREAIAFPRQTPDRHDIERQFSEDELEMSHGPYVDELESSTSFDAHTQSVGAPSM